HPIIMGRKTWESLGRPLPGRTNIVVTRQPGYAAEGAVVTSSLQAALDACLDEKAPYVIGGAQIYAQALPLADRVVATEVHTEAVGDAWFPTLPPAQWRETDRQPQAEENGLQYDFVTYERILPA
ncbi:MAG TPA: dihydrofolate reductase, partial [Bordetella sp.]